MPSGPVDNPYPSHQSAESVLDRQTGSVRVHERDMLQDMEDVSESESDTSQPDYDMEVLPSAIGAHVAETEAVGACEEDIGEEDVRTAGVQKGNVRDTIHNGVKNIIRATQRQGEV